MKNQFSPSPAEPFPYPDDPLNQISRSLDRLSVALREPTNDLHSLFCLGCKMSLDRMLASLEVTA